MERMETYCNTLQLNLDGIYSLFEFCPDGISVKNKDLTYSIVNESYCKLFSCKYRNEIEGSAKNKYLSEANQKLINDVDCEIRKNLYPINYVINIQEEKLLNVSSYPILKNNNFAGLISVVKDITQEEQLKEKFVNKHFERINAEKQLQCQREIFVASVGHDLKNPTIAQIRGLELLLNGGFGELNNSQKELVGMILDSCRYMNGMLSSLLETYRNYGGAVRLNFTEFSLKELVNECVSEMIYVARDKEVKISISANSDSAFIINADKIQIKRVIMNLLSNAIKYAFKNSTLDLRIYKNGEKVHFEFENSSPYIPKEKQKQIFERYVSYAESYKELGIGLGLYASKKIIESHGGDLYVQSFEENRNIFGFKIPEFQTKTESRVIKF